jgi:hypothetical protein
MGVRIPRLAMVLLAACLAACETAYKDGVPNERSPWFLVPVASKLVLHRSIEIAPGQGAAYLQNGRLLPWYDVDQHGSYCALSVPARWDVAQLVSPGEYVVRGVSQRPLFTLAAAQGGALRRVATRERDGDGMTYEVLATVMDIHSQQQPEVRALTCASWCLPQGRMCNTVEDIRRALGPYFTVELAGPKRAS